MSYKLREYQEKAKTTTVDYFSSQAKHRPMVVVPTAGGKSLIIAMAVKELSGKVIVLQPSVELLKQNYMKYENVIKEHPDLEPASLYSASVGVKEVGRVTFATIGSIFKKPELFSDIEHVLIDECHFVPPDKNSMYMKFLGALPRAQVLGLTATAFRLKTYTDPFTGKKFSKINLLNRERPSFFNKFAHITQIKELYDLGFLCPLKYIEMQWDGSFLQVNSTGAEYTENSLKEAIERNQVIQKIPGILDQAFKKGRKACLVFVRAVEEARDLARITPFSAYVHAETDDKERADIIKNFKNGSIKTIYNVGILTTGFDFPELDTVILARPTMSLALYVQMIGRGMRLAEGKEYCSILDMCGNFKKFGRVEDLRYEDDELHGWVLRNNERILSGVRLDELV